MNNKNIKLVISRNWNLINEESEGSKEEKDPYEECEITINKIKNDIRKLQKQFKSIGVSNTTSLNGSNIIKKLNNMHEMFCDFEPVRKKFHRDNEARQANPNNEGNMRSESDVKIDAKADRTVEKKAMDVSKKYDMDIQLVDEIVESVTKQLRKSGINEVRYIDSMQFNDEDPDDFPYEEESEEDMNQDFNLTQIEREQEIPNILQNIKKATNGKIKIGSEYSGNSTKDSVYYKCKINNEVGRFIINKLPINPDKYGYGDASGKYHFSIYDLSHTMRGDFDTIVEYINGY